jgi:hypothetical protein
MGKDRAPKQPAVVVPQPKQPGLGEALKGGAAQVLAPQKRKLDINIVNATNRTQVVLLVSVFDSVTGEPFRLLQPGEVTFWWRLAGLVEGDLTPADVPIRAYSGMPGYECYALWTDPSMAGETFWLGVAVDTLQAQGQAMTSFVASA